MRQSQLLSPTAQLLKHRWCAEGRVGTHCSSAHATIADEHGKHYRWDQLMERQLQAQATGAGGAWPGAGIAEACAELPVHPAVEVFETSLCGVGAARGARVRAGCAIQPHTFLGFYQGWVGTEAEAALLWQKFKHGDSDRDGFRDGKRVTGTMVSKWWPVPSDAVRGAACTLRRRTAAIALFHGYLVRVASVEVQTGANSSAKRRNIVVSAIGPDGDFIGNALGRINDGCGDPFAAGRDSDGGSSGGSGGGSNDCYCDGEAPLARDSSSVVDRPANVEFVQIAHAGWVYLGVVSTAAISEGEELLMSYDGEYWTTQRRMRREMCGLNRLCEDEGHSEAERVQMGNLRPFCCFRTSITRICGWLRDWFHVGSLWWRAWTEDAGFAATARQELLHEEARLGFA